MGFESWALKFAQFHNIYYVLSLVGDSPSEEWVFKVILLISLQKK